MFTTETEQRILLNDKDYGFHILHAQGVKSIDWDVALNKKYRNWVLKERLQYLAFAIVIVGIFATGFL